MAKTGPNELCPCGSGKKHKKCCQLKLEQEERGHREMLESLSMEEELQKTVDAGTGTQRKGRFYEFAMPLLYQNEDDAEQEALDLAAMIFNLCLIRDASMRQAKQRDLVNSLFSKRAERQSFESVAGMMLKRFQKLFPDLTDPSKAEPVLGPSGWMIPAPVSELISLGVSSFGIVSIDYERMGIGKEHVAELIRILQTPEFWTEQSPENWAPLHAWRALGQMGAKEAIAPLVEIIKTHHDNYLVKNDIGLPFGFLGFEPYPLLRALILDSSQAEGARVIAFQAIGHIAKTWPHARAECESFLSEQLAKDESIEINGAILEGLIVGVGVSELSETMTSLIEQGRMPSDFGTIDDVRASILRSQDLSAKLGAI